MLIIDNGSRHIRALTTLLQAYDPVVVSYGDLESASIAKDEVIILSGGHKVPIVLWHDRWYRRELDIIARHPGLIIGICLGAELIAHHYGSSLRRLPGLLRGNTQLTPTRHDTHGFFAGHQYMYESHRWAITSVKPPLVALATSRTGVEAFCHTTKPRYGLQFHPEVHRHNPNILLTLIESYHTKNDPQ